MRLLLNNGYDAEKCFRCNHGDDWEDLSESGYSQHQEEKVAVSSLFSASLQSCLSSRTTSLCQFNVVCPVLWFRQRLLAGEPGGPSCVDPPRLRRSGFSLRQTEKDPGETQGVASHSQDHTWVRWLVETMWLKSCRSEPADQDATCVVKETAVLCDPGNPRSLTHLSRVEIRKHLSCSGLTSMQLPTRLKDYLLFKENDLYAKVICREDWAKVSTLWVLNVFLLWFM